jgi:hypothetical protein
MSGLPSVFQMAHFCPVCNEQCSCLTAEVQDDDEIVNGCTHDCATADATHAPDECCDCAACLRAMGTYKPGHSGGFPF